MNEKNMLSKMSEIYVAQYSYLIKEVVGRTFISDDFRRKFIYDYVGSLYKEKDEKVLRQIEDDTTVGIISIKRSCPNCGETMEVYVNASMTFQQEV